MRVFSLVAAFFLFATPLLGQDADRSVADGGVHVDGWQLRIDRRPLEAGMSATDSRMVEEDGALRLSIGPAGIFWNPEHTASGDYTISATFEEHAMRTAHPHPYGIFIGGSDLETPEEKLLYCIVYGDGTFAVKTFRGSTVTTIAERQPSDAVRQANEEGAATNEVAWRVEGDTASCLVNGQEAASFSRDEVVGPDKLASLDGIYGIRVSHNVELTVRDFGMAGGM